MTGSPDERIVTRRLVSWMTVGALALGAVALGPTFIILIFTTPPDDRVVSTLGLKLLALVVAAFALVAVAVTVLVGGAYARSVRSKGP